MRLEHGVQVSEYDQKISQSQTARQHEEEPQNTNSLKTSERQLKENNQLYLSHQDDCNTKTNPKYYITKQGPNTEPQQTVGATILLK